MKAPITKIARVAAVSAALLYAGATAAADSGSVGAFPPAQIPQLPAMHSYQPYAGLQFGFRPEPPAQRGVQDDRPPIPGPTRVPPLIEYGKAPSPYAAQGYAYCSEQARGFEPARDGHPSTAVETGCR